MKEVEYIRCKFCKKKFSRLKNKSPNGKTPKGVRKSGAVTCSQDCSRKNKYNRYKTG